MSDDYLERWNEESGDLDLPGRLDLMADEFFIDDSTENLAHAIAAEVRTLLDALEASEKALRAWKKYDWYRDQPMTETNQIEQVQCVSHARDLTPKALAKIEAFRSGTGGDE